MPRLLKINKYAFLLFLLTVSLTAFISCSSDDDAVSSRAYSGHENDRDANNFAAVYPETVGTRLDDCHTCHRSGVSGTDTAKVYNSCDYCHLIEFPNSSYTTGVPKTFEDTLNAFGKAYYSSGRSKVALRNIAKDDSDGDGYTNEYEISEMRYPGDDSSKPDQPLAPTVVLTLDDLENMPTYTEFLLMNTTKQQFDDYATYEGVRIIDLLKSAGVDVSGAEGITVYAPDGFGKDYSMNDITAQYPNGVFYKTPEFSDPDMELVNYPSVLPETAVDGKEIPDALYLMLAIYRDGVLLDKSYYESETGRLTGEGPYRTIMPQVTPSRPDRGSKFNVYGDGWDFDAVIDHNAGNCVRGACVIRVNPMPEGYEEYDWKNGWSLIEDGKVIIYGYGVSGK